MLFTPENAVKVLDCKKTMTRRTVKDNERAIRGWIDGAYRIYGVNTEDKDPRGKGRIKWMVGRTYAVQPGRGKPAIGRIRLLSIRKEPLQDINLADVIAEGGPFGYSAAYDEDYGALWDSINSKGNQWRDNLDVWVLTFELARQ